MQETKDVLGIIRDIAIILFVMASFFIGYEVTTAIADFSNTYQQEQVIETGN